MPSPVVITSYPMAHRVSDPLLITKRYGAGCVDGTYTCSAYLGQVGFIARQ
jgi:hypothetical protein